MKITTVGLYLAKNVFQVHGADEKGKTVVRKTLKRGRGDDRNPNTTEQGAWRGAAQ